MVVIVWYLDLQIPLQSVPITSFQFKSHLWHCLLIQHYVIKFVSDLRQVSGFLQVLPISSTNKTYCQDIAEIFLKVALNTMTSNPV
jgi:hypothetical protein